MLVVTWGNGLYMSLRVAEWLAAEGIGCRVLDLRWLAPLPIDDMVRHAVDIGRVVVVDETRRSGGVGEAIVSGLVECGVDVPITRVAGQDSFVPLADAANLVLVSEDDIEQAIRSGRRECRTIPRTMTSTRQTTFWAYLAAGATSSGTGTRKPGGQGGRSIARTHPHHRATPSQLIGARSKATIKAKPVATAIAGCASRLGRSIRARRRGSLNTERRQRDDCRR